MSRCVTSAADIAEDLNQDTSGRQFGRRGRLLRHCSVSAKLSVKKDGELGFTCFDTAFRRAFRNPSSATIGIAQAEYQLCVSPR